ncbi:MAG: tetratricopeptide repeat protein [Omnitrophica bacterium]|nr:tetratricopeptide repeat protein [Candidatus Omnitrophota bacterium]
MKIAKKSAKGLKLRLVSFLTGFIIFCLCTSLSFAQSQKFITNLYSNYLKGIFYAAKGDYALGLKELEKAKAKDPKSIQIRLKIATVLIRLERIEEAEKVLKEAKKIDPDNIDVSLALIFVYSYSHKDKELETEYEYFLESAHKSKPKDTGISEYLAQFYFYKKKPKEAIKIYERILNNNPNNIEAIFWLGYIYEEVNRHKEAIKVWEKGLGIDPSYAPILNSLAYIYAKDGIKLKKAEKMIKKALEKEPKNGAYLDSLGWVYFKKGDYKNAENYLTKAISYIKDPEIYGHLGDFYIKIGNPEKGISYYQEGLTYFPDDKNLQSKVKKYGKKDKTLKK